MSGSRWTCRRGAVIEMHEPVIAQVSFSQVVSPSARADTHRENTGTDDTHQATDDERPRRRDLFDDPRAQIYPIGRSHRILIGDIALPIPGSSRDEQVSGRIAKDLEPLPAAVKCPALPRHAVFVIALW